ncbi:DNA methylase [Gordonia sp. N1V]|uniref:DNA methylase n=1 Tax=Gordonia sp. N1V TaxID=3034163 RepID=UPI0023E25F8D|nr:DNA methylase [Gordonia sp. N1V]MDF3280462.1 DNA methylase [Gordonia sp. N1V]
MSRPVLLDLFCGAGGATKGYQDAGFYVVGVDLHPQPNYCGDKFIQTDAMQLLRDLVGGPFKPLVAGTLGRVVAVHASPPCQRYSAMSKCRPDIAEKYPDLVAPVRELLKRLGKPYVIENVPGAPLIDPVMLCGTMFGRELYRHRLFESNLPLIAPGHPKHVVPASKAGHWTPGTIMSISGHVSPIAHARNIMGIGWCTREELAEAIPPAYTEFIGRQIMASLKAVA